MIRAEPTGSAVQAIHRDLTGLRRRRLVALLSYLGLVALLMAALAVAPAKTPSLTRDAPWMAALFLLFVGSGLGAALTVGVPVLRRSAAYGVGGMAAAALVAGLALTIDLELADAVPATHAKCFVFGSVIAAVAMVTLGVLSGRLWRRFPSPGLFLAVGVTGVGVAALHLRCPSTDPVHLFGTHLGPLIVLYAIARLIVVAREAALADADSST